MAKLKVFRAASGFYDSYVAAASRAAALRAWGAKTDLFAMGAAEQITDANLTERPLAKPGVVFKVKRDSKEAAGGFEEVKKSTANRKRPSRKNLDAAEDALAKLLKANGAELTNIEREIEALQKRRVAMIASHARLVSKAEAKRDEAAEIYANAKWN